MFIDLKKLLFVFSIDYKTVCCALADNQLYQIDEVTFNSKIKFGMKYLESYVNIPFHLNLEFETSYFTDAILTQNNKVEKVIQSNSCEDSKVVRIDNEKIYDIDSNQYYHFTFTDTEIQTINSILDQFKLNPRETKHILYILIISKNIHYQININKLDSNNNHSLTIFEDFIKWFCFSYYYPNEELFIQSLLVKRKKIDTDILSYKFINKKDLDKNNELDYHDFSLVRNLKTRDLSEFSNISKLFIFSYENIE